MSLRAVELCQVVTDALTAASGSTATVSREYVPAIDPDVLTDGERVVRVYWVSHEDGGPVSRGADADHIGVGVLVVERYTAAGEAPVAWVDERVRWVGEVVKQYLADARQTFDGAYSLTAEFEVPDPDRLVSSVFWMNTVIVFRDEGC